MRHSPICLPLDPELGSCHWHWQSYFVLWIWCSWQKKGWSSRPRIPQILGPALLSRSLAAFELTYPSRSLKEVVGIFISPHYRKSSNLLQRAWLEETGSEPYMQENILGFSPPVTLNWQSRTQASTSQVDSGGLCLQCFPQGNGNSHRPSQCRPSHRNLVLESFSRNFSLSALSHGSRTVVPLTFKAS